MVQSISLRCLYSAVILQKQPELYIQGRFFEDSVFHVKIKKGEEFNKGFQYQEKHLIDTQFI